MIAPPERVKPQLLRLEILECLPRPARSRRIDFRELAAAGWVGEGFVIACRLCAAGGWGPVSAEMVSAKVDERGGELAFSPVSELAAALNNL